MSHFLDRLEKVRGLPVLIGVALVILNFMVRAASLALIPPGQPANYVVLLFTEGNLLLHLGVVVGLLGVLIGDIL